MKNELYDTNLPSYNEAHALQQLLQTIESEVTSDGHRMDKYDDYCGGQFTITVGGVQTAFYLGGPQIDGLFAFVQHIADENFYTVDIDRSTVDG